MLVSNDKGTQLINARRIYITIGTTEYELMDTEEGLKLTRVDNSGGIQILPEGQNMVTIQPRTK